MKYQLLLKVIGVLAETKMPQIVLVNEPITAIDPARQLKDALNRDRSIVVAKGPNVHTVYVIVLAATLRAYPNLVELLEKMNGVTIYATTLHGDVFATYYTITKAHK